MKLRSVLLPQSLEAILSGRDELGLLADVEPIKVKATQQEDSTIVKFKEIITFYQTHGREPKEQTQQERKLAVRLKAYRERLDLRTIVLSYDTVGLLEKEATPTAPSKELQTIEDIFNNDNLDLLDDIDTSIFNLNNRATLKEKDLPDEIATRKPCKDFYLFKKTFQKLQQMVQSKSVLIKRLSSKSEVFVGQAFILRGQLCYVDCILDKNAGGDKKYNPRLRVIFSNETETDLLMLSLASAMYKDPHSKRIDYSPNLWSKPEMHISPQTDPTGFIYILGTESTALALAQFKRCGKLVKIGYSAQKVQERIKNAETERTYLEAPVKLLAEITCYNLNPQKFENLIHAFLYEQRLNITLIAHDGTSYHPEEWFAVDAETAVSVCRKIVEGTITQYRMDNVSGKIRLKE